MCVYQIFVWSMKTGRLLDVLSGHEGPVHGLMFSPTTVSPRVSYVNRLVLLICVRLSSTLHPLIQTLVAGTYHLLSPILGILDVLLDDIVTIVTLLLCGVNG